MRETKQRILRQQSTTKYHENLNFFVEIILKKNQFNKKVCAALMEFCPQYCARIATEIYDKWRVLSWLLTAFGVHKVLRRKCRLTDYCRLFRIYLFNKTINEFSEYGSWNFLLQRMICHKIHICILCGLHELCECDSSNFVL